MALTKKKKLLYALLALLILLIIWQFQLLTYGFRQAKGQLTLIWNTRPVAEVLQDPQVPDSLKTKIELIQEIRTFAFDSLGIKQNDNYTSFYDQHGKPILWVVTACPPFEMKAYEWEFPILGKFSYKGFFNYEIAEEEEKTMKEKGLDTEIGEVSAWSTLGWLKDPILSSMLRRKPGSLANLIIHELTHGTLYVKNNVEFNENLASFVGDFGARKFLAQKYGVESVEYKEYEKSLTFQQEYSTRALHWAKQLDSTYKRFDSTTPLEKKKVAKDTVLIRAKTDLKKLLQTNHLYSARHEKEFAKFNNTYFIDFITYRAQQNRFEVEFRTKFNSNFPAYMQYLKVTYPGM